jgi:hypothetical protein
MKVNGVIDPGLVTVAEDGEGMEILNFPIKALREQILNCINCLPGGEFVSAAEIKKSLAQWNGIPLTVDHPRDSDGRLEFAQSTPEFLESIKIGEITNARWKNGFLWVDAHLNRVKAAVTVEGRGIISALLGGGPDVEVSTGYGMELDFRSGSFEGERFHFAQTDIMPDHLALLPIGMAGACSVEDGCGAARAAQSLVAAAARHEPEELVVPDPKTKDGRLYAAFKSLLGIATEKEEPEGDEPAGNAADPPEGDDPKPGEPGGTPHSPKDEDGSMDRNVLILALVAAASVDFSKEELEAFNDERLNSLATLAGCGCKDGDKTPPGDPPAGNAEGDGSEGDDPNAADPPAASSENAPIGLTPEHIAALDAVTAFSKNIPALEALVSNAQATADAEREELVTNLTANERCVVGKEDLEGLPLTVLRGMKRSFEAVDYSGVGGPRSLGITEENDQGFMPLRVVEPAKAAGSGGDA